jgi:MFS family permease
VGPLVPLFALDVLTAFTVGMVPPLLPLIAEEWTLSPAQVGLVNTVYAAGRLATSYTASRLRTRLGTRAVVYLGLAVAMAGLVLCGLGPRFPAFLAGRVLMGIGGGSAFLAILGQLLEASPAAWRGRITNAFEAMAILSLGVGGILGAWLAEHAGWRPVFVAAGPILLSGLLLWRRLDPGAGRTAPRPGTGRADTRAGDHRRLWPVYGASLALSLTWSGLFATLAPLLGHQGYGLGAGALGWALAAGYLAELLGLFGLGLLVDRVRREPVFLGGAAVVAAGGLVLATGAHPGAFVLGLVLIGGGFAIWMVPATVLTDRVGTPLPHGHLAVYRTSMDVGMVLGPLLIGFLAGFGGARLAAGCAGLVLVAAAVHLARAGR